MTALECPCSRPLPHGRTLCKHCEQQLAQNLRQAASLIRDLDITAARQDRTTPPGATIGHATGHPAPVRFDAARMRDLLTQHLTHTRGITPDMWAAHESGPSYHARLEDLIQKAVALVDLPPERIHLGTCGSDMSDTHGEDAICTNELTAPLGAAMVTCPDCGVSWDVKARQDQKLADAWDALANPPTIVRALETQGLTVKLKHIENWIQLGHLEAAGINDHGHPLYRISEVHAVAQRMHARRQQATR